MPRGASEIPDLKLVRLQGLIEYFQAPPNLVLMNLFGGFNAESDEIRWEQQVGTRGMAPFSAPTAKAQRLAPLGVSDNGAFAAFWKEKMYLDELFLNNLRQPGTLQTYETALRKLSREMNRMRYRSDRRKEWMFAKMLTGGTFDYFTNRGLSFTVDYGVPAVNMPTLAASRKWDAGASRNILEDIFDAKLFLQNEIGARIDYAIFTTEVLKLMIFDTGIQALLQKSTFGQGDLFTRPVAVLGSLLDIPNMLLYDEQYQVIAEITSAVTADSTVAISVDDPTDFEAGGTLRFIDVSAGTHEDETISSVSASAGTVTVSTAPSTSYKAGEDKVVMTKKFVPTDRFTMFASMVENQPIAEYMNSPFGLDRVWGMKVDQEVEWDPEGVWVRVQNKGLPILYNKDAIYSIRVK